MHVTLVALNVFTPDFHENVRANTPEPAHVRGGCDCAFACRYAELSS